jgi:RNA polymerase sigma-70 factor (ECF subfamily)
MEDMISALDAAAVRGPEDREVWPYEAGEDVVVALAALEPAAWRQLFLQNHRRVFKYALVRAGNTADADDIASSTFAAAVRGIREFRYQGVPIAAWLLRIAHNETMRALQRRKRTATATLDHPQAVARSSPDEIGPHDDLADVGDAMGRLKQEHRAVLMLRIVEDRSIQDVARLLDKSEAAVKMLQARALQALRRELDG